MVGKGRGYVVFESFVALCMDQNTKYFHHKASQHRKKNTIIRVKDVHGLWRSHDELDVEIVNYFTNLFALTSNACDLTFWKVWSVRSQMN